MSIISKGEVWYMTPGPWYACSEPERPTDPYVVWHYDDCRPCRIKAEANLSVYPETTSGRHLIFRMDNGYWPREEQL